MSTPICRTSVGWASGVLHAQGTFSATAGGEGDYVGEVCTT